MNIKFIIAIERAIANTEITVRSPAKNQSDVGCALRTATAINKIENIRSPAKNQAKNQLDVGCALRTATAINKIKNIRSPAKNQSFWLWLCLSQAN